VSVIAIINHKGGVGKTTTTVNLGAALQELGRRVLLVDLDPQASLTIHLGLQRPEALPANVGHALAAALNGEPAPTFREILIASPAGLDLIPSGNRLADAEPVLGRETEPGSALRRCLAPLRDAYDDVLIDCLPSRTPLAHAALAAADAILVPTQTDYLAIQALEPTFQTARQAQQQGNPSLRVLGILLTMVDLRTNHSRWAIDAVRRGFEGQARVFETVIGLQVGFKESSKDGVSVLRRQPGSAGALAYRNLAREVVAATDALAGAEGEGRADRPEAATEGMPAVSREAGSPAPGAEPGGAAEPGHPVALPSTPPMVGTLTTRLDAHVSSPTAPGVPPAPDPIEDLVLPACPFLGLAVDRTTRLDHPDEAQRCWADGTPFAIDPEWQRVACLDRLFWSCPRYGGNVFAVFSKPSASDASLISRLASWLHRRR
jgi:chromosome partitioning protein